MRRIDIVYDGRDYSLADVALDDLKGRIEAAATTGSFWLEVNKGEGTVQKAELLITSTTMISLTGIDAD